MSHLRSRRAFGCPIHIIGRADLEVCAGVHRGFVMKKVVESDCWAHLSVMGIVSPIHADPLGGDLTSNRGAASFGGARCLSHSSSIVKRNSFISLISVITIA